MDKRFKKPKYYAHFERKPQQGWQMAVDASGQVASDSFVEVAHRALTFERMNRIHRIEVRSRGSK